MKVIGWHTGLLWGLVGFFIFAGTLNIAAPASMIEEYLRWGYPQWFHYVTGALEWASALLMVRRGTRKAGLALGTLVMGAAAVTLAVAGDAPHGAFPALILVALLAASAPYWNRKHAVA